MNQCHVVDESFAINQLRWTKQKARTDNIVYFCTNHHDLYDKKRRGAPQGDPMQFSPAIISDYVNEKFHVLNPNSGEIEAFDWPLDLQNSVQVNRHYFDWKNARVHEDLIDKLYELNLPYYDYEATPEAIRDGSADDLFTLYR